MRINKPEGILRSTDTSGIIPSLGGDDFLSRVNTTITNFKELLLIVKQMRGIPLNNPPSPSKEMREPNPPTKPGQDMTEFIQLIIASGYGDTPIKKLIQKLEPYTIKQILELIKNVRPKQ